MAAVIERNRIALPDLAIHRFVGASPEAVFRAWTDPAQVAAWWGPHGFANHLCAVDAVPGGHYTIHMKGPEGQGYKGSGVFREVDAPSRLVFTCLLEDATGAALIDALITVVAVADGGRTRLSFEATVLCAAPRASGYFGEMKDGWRQSLDRLCSILNAL